MESQILAAARNSDEFQSYGVDGRNAVPIPMPYTAGEESRLARQFMGLAKKLPTTADKVAFFQQVDAYIGTLGTALVNEDASNLDADSLQPGDVSSTQNLRNIIAYAYEKL